MEQTQIRAESQPEQVRKQLEASRTELERATEPQERIRLLNEIGFAQGLLNDPDALPTLRQAVDLAQQNQLKAAEASTMLRLAAVMQHLNFTAISTFEHALKLCQEQSTPDDCLQQLGEYYVKLGHLEQAIGLFEEIVTLRRAAGDPERILVTEQALTDARERLKGPVAKKAVVETEPAAPTTAATPILVETPTPPKVSWMEWLSYRSYAVAQVLFFIPLIVLLGFDGFTIVDAAIILVLIAVSTVVGLLRQTTSTSEVNEFAELDKTLKNGGKYTLVELFGTYCAGCATMNPLVDRLEAENNPRLQILRLNIESPPGIYLKPEKTTFTPTFQLYDPYGNKIRETYMIMDRARILYEVERLSRGSGPLVPPR